MISAFQCFPMHAGRRQCEFASHTVARRVEAMAKETAKKAGFEPYVRWGRFHPSLIGIPPALCDWRFSNHLLLQPCHMVEGPFLPWQFRIGLPHVGKRLASLPKDRKFTNCAHRFACTREPLPRYLYSRLFSLYRLPMLTAESVFFPGRAEAVDRAKPSNIKAF